MNIPSRSWLLRPVLAGTCTLGEVKTVLTIDDVADLNEALDLRDAMEIESQRYQKERAKQR